MTIIHIDRGALGKALPLLRVKLESIGDVTLVVAIQTSPDGVNWTTTRTDHIPIPAGPKEKR